MKKKILCLCRQGLAVCLASLIACNAIPTSSSSATAARLERIRYDGETLLRGLFFGVGPVADFFPEIWDNPRIRQLKEASQLSPEMQLKNVDAIMAKLTQDHPKFWASFADNMQSGDRVRIEKGVLEAAQLLSAMFSVNVSTDGLPCNVVVTDPSVSKPTIVAVDAAAVAAAVVTIAAAAAAIAVTIVAIVVIFFVFLGASDDDKGSSLRRDFWIDLIATRLGPEEG